MVILYVDELTRQKNAALRHENHNQTLWVSDRLFVSRLHLLLSITAITAQTTTTIHTSEAGKTLDNMGMILHHNTISRQMSQTTLFIHYYYINQKKSSQNLTLFL